MAHVIGSPFSIRLAAESLVKPFSILIARQHVPLQTPHSLGKRPACDARHQCLAKAATARAWLDEQLLEQCGRTQVVGEGHFQHHRVASQNPILLGDEYLALRGIAKCPSQQFSLSDTKFIQIAFEFSQCGHEFDQHGHVSRHSQTYFAGRPQHAHPIAT